MAKAEMEICLRGKTPEEWRRIDAVLTAAVKAIGAMEAVLFKDVGPDDVIAIDDLKHATVDYLKVAALQKERER